MEQTGKTSIRVSGKTVTGTTVNNTENPSDPWTYLKGDNGRYYTTLKSKQAWRDLQTALTPDKYKTAISRIEKWVAPTTPKGETPVEPEANATTATTSVPDAPVTAQPAVPETPGVTPASAESPWKAVDTTTPTQTTTPNATVASTQKWRKWYSNGYRNIPGSMPPANNMRLTDSGISVVANTKNDANANIRAELASAGIDSYGNTGVLVYKELPNKTIESKWLTYNK